MTKLPVGTRGRIDNFYFAALARLPHNIFHAQFYASVWVIARVVPLDIKKVQCYYMTVYAIVSKCASAVLSVCVVPIFSFSIFYPLSLCYATTIFGYRHDTIRRAYVFDTIHVRLFLFLFSYSVHDGCLIRVHHVLLSLTR